MTNMGTVSTKISIRKKHFSIEVKILKNAKTLKAVRNGTQKGAKDFSQEVADLKMVVHINT